MRKTVGRLCVLVSALVAVGGVLAPAASAGERLADPGNPCDRFTDLCVYWGQQFQGASVRFGGDATDHLTWHYPEPGRGAGERVGNNGGSFANWRLDRSVTVYYNPAVNGGRPPGPSLYIPPNTAYTCAAAGPNICNNNRSHFYN